jgi:cytochrome P450
MTEATEETEATERIHKVTTPVGDPAWLVTRYDLVRSLLADTRLGRTHPEPERASRFSESAFLGQPWPGDPEEERADHIRFRRLLARSFSARRMERLRPRIMAITTEMLDAMEAMSPPVDFHQAVSYPLPVLVICELLGVPYEDRDDFGRWSEDVARMDIGEQSAAGLQSLFVYMQALIERKREEPGHDVISDLLAAQESSGMSDMEVAQTSAGLLFAGHITTVNAIDHGVFLFLTHPDQREALERDPSLVPLAVEEILRYRDPVQSERRANAGLPRWASADIEIDGVTIPAGDLVLLSLDAANSDEATFPNACSFDTGRVDNPHVTFGHGYRYCMGAPLARMELESVFGTLFKRFPALELAVSPQEVVRRTNMLAGGFESMPVRW